MLNKLQRSGGLFAILLVITVAIFTGAFGSGAVYGQENEYTYLPLVIAGCSNAIPFQDASNLALEKEMLAALNHQRAINGGLAPLVMNASLVQIARFHSLDMADSGELSHIGSGGDTPEVRFGWLCETFTSGGEIIGGNSSSSIANMVDAWMKSPPHKALILEPNFTLAGVGYVYLPGGEFSHYWTVDFGVKP